MMKLLSLEFWIGVQFLIDLVFVGLLLGLVKRLNRERMADAAVAQEMIPDKPGLAVNPTAVTIVEMLEPLVRESKSVSLRFEDQIKEKKLLIKELNRSLDAKIISLNLLMARADSMLASGSREGAEAKAKPISPPETSDSFDQQQAILDLFSQGLDDRDIAAKLSLPKGEVQLIVGLKKKMLEMEKTR